ncbi:hypothetical protein BKM31_56670 [[Actinomadura] parvosata subsp. kistnae]|uniref:DUF4328 domain-containing protein n=1 Tax=[Actinomadura] parvosata subsp. kistnae TaxID=1909395 RepID=A0A1V0AHK4_9ACTN|nr:DUF4328 domain-containing protein [Nonomuraea sp. ATCC 55076]AQZ69663.1 hypothetical protein BKM31_56670 [Nonomuraea sp. ATCC 55076]
MARGEINVRYTQASPARAASAVYVTLTAQILSLGALVSFELSRGRRLAAELAAFGGRPQGADAEAVVGAVTLFAVLMMLVAVTTVAAAAAYVTWLVRARQANDRSAATAPVAAAWLLPGVNLVAPAVLVDEVWRGTRPPAGRRGRWLALLGSWWAAWLGTLALFTIRLPLDASAGDLTGVGVPELACASVAALLCAGTVRELTRLQRAARSARVVEPGTLRPFSPQPAPGSTAVGRTS